MTLLSLIYQGDLHPSSDDKVIPAAAYSKLVEAGEIIEKAKEDAATLLKKTEEKCRQLRAKAMEEGKAQGLETYNEQILRLADSVKQMRLDLQAMVLPIALKAAKKIVRKQLDLFPDTIVDIVLDILKPIGQSQRVTIYVHKGDKEILESQRPRLKEVLEHVEVLSIEERDGLHPGDCIVKTATGMINATKENEWDALERAFDRYHKGSISG